MKKINEKLCVGDKIKLWKMLDELMVPGTKGVVQGVSNVMGDTIYMVKWETGENLNLLSDVDIWILEERANENCNPNIQENTLLESNMSRFESERDFIKKNKEILDEFDTIKLLKFLEALRKCSWVNMFQAAHYLYAGKENIKKMHPFQDESEPCEEMLELADDAKYEMINGTISYLQSKNQEIDLDKVNSRIRRTANIILEWFMMRR